MTYSRAYKKTQRKIEKREAQRKLTIQGKKVVSVGRKGIKIVDSFTPYVKTKESFVQYRKRYLEYYQGDQK